MRPPSGVNFTPLTSTFHTTCCKRTASPDTWHCPASNAYEIWILLALAAGLTISTASATIRVRSTWLTSSRNCPVMMRDTSSRSSISCFWFFALRSITSRPCALLGAAQQVRPAENRGQRCAKVVRERCQELVLYPVGSLRFGPRPSLAIQKPVTLFLCALKFNQVMVQFPYVPLGLR